VERELPIRILIVDDHAVVRQGVRMFLRTDRELKIVGEAADGAEAVRLARELKPDVILMDLLMPVMDGIAATAAIRQELPETEILALTSVVEHASVVGAIRAGAIGYLLKDTQSADLRHAIRAAALHQVQLSAEAAARLVKEIRMPERADLLSARETEVARLIANGASNKQIAGRLGIGDETVKTHVSSILKKLGANSRTQAALYALRIGLVSK
jgi:DNA-binding NarL/FixJ family response regulator